jgi:hypothetical protein
MPNIGTYSTYASNSARTKKGLFLQTLGEVKKDCTFILETVLTTPHFGVSYAQGKKLRIIHYVGDSIFLEKKTGSCSILGRENPILGGVVTEDRQQILSSRF